MILSPCASPHSSNTASPPGLSYTAQASTAARSWRSKFSYPTKGVSNARIASHAMWGQQTWQRPSD